MPNPFGPTSGETARLAPMRATKPLAVKPQTFNVKPPKTPKAPTHSPYDTFTQPLPYGVTQIPGLAEAGYNTDVANANKLASMGFLSPDQINAQAASRSAAVGGISDSLRNALAGIQSATVGQGNAGTATLAGQQSQIGAAGNPVASATGVPNVGVQGAPAIQAVLGSQTAAGGNRYGGLEAAAASSGAQNQQKALDQGASDIQTNNLNIAKNLASLLSGVSPESAREASMTQANTGVRSSNIANQLTVYQNLVNQQQTAAALGDKQGEAAADRALKQWETQQTNTTKIKTTNANNATKIATTGITQSGQTARAKAAAAAKIKAAQTAAANKAKTGSSSTSTVGSYKNYKVTVLLPSSTVADPNTGKIKVVPAKRVVKTVPANVWNRFNGSGPKGQRKLKIIGVPEGSKVQSATGY